ncbi:hypothetical protein ACRWHP_29915 [Escherichia coli]
MGIWSDSLLDALETCNADKQAIEALERRRLNRQNGEAHAEK